MPTLRTVTLGCKVNQYETQYVREGLLRAGYRDAADGERADLCVVNTCTVTREADYKSRKILRALARENPGTRILVMGCYATRAARELAALPGVVEVLTDKRRLPELLARFGLPDAPKGIRAFNWRHRAWVKVQDGCRGECSYCIVPKVRATLWSRPVCEVLEEVQCLRDAGYREIVLTGIHLGHYGLDASQPAGDQGADLAGLVERILELKGDFRIRLSSVEAAEVTPSLVTGMADYPERICPHLHLPLQSGSDRVLLQMRRRYSARQFLETCRTVDQRVQGLAITTDVIVGFPGESEADFEATCQVVEEVGFAKVHVFRYSPRAGTLAAGFAEQVPEAIKQRRAAELGRISRRLHRRYLERLSGQRLRVLIQSAVAGRPGRLLGTSGNYAPVELAGTPADEGRLVWVVAGEVVDGRVRAVSKAGGVGEPVASATGD